jgi:hypothetical protein
MARKSASGLAAVVNRRAPDRHDPGIHGGRQPYFRALHAACAEPRHYGAVGTQQLEYVYVSLCEVAVRQPGLVRCNHPLLFLRLRAADDQL